VRHTFRYTVDLDGEPGELVELAAEDTHHLTRVVRRGAGDVCEVIDTAGRIWPAVVEDPGPPARVRLAAAPRAGAAPVPVDLFVGVADWGRLDTVVEKATELGVARLTFFASDRARRKADGGAFDGRRERWGRIAEAAARQSGRGARPHLAGLVPFSTVVDEISTRDAFLLDAAGEHGLGDTLRRRDPQSAAIVVGPDAGLTGDEVARLRAAGAATCSLAGATLRTETAAIAAAAIAADHYGAG
jgi:16S rRNA (uracil1498-N3)-methyltransferase